MANIVGLAWELTSVTGWGVYGTHLTLGLARTETMRPVLLKRPARLELNGERQRILQPLLEEQEGILRQVLASGAARFKLPFPIIKTLLPGFVEVSASKVFTSDEEIGVLFFENPHLTPAEVARGQRYRAVVAGSSWNARVLEDHGLRNVHTILQGVDTARFHPRTRSGDRERFVIFSGGKLERRKGQDLVLAAFRRFVARHPDAVLLTAWQNAWPEKLADLDQSGLVQGRPALRGDTLDIAAWAYENGCPEGSVIDVGWVPNERMPDVLAEAHCAVFPSRYESGTNLPAMEAMAMGLPTVVSANTGHLDLLVEGGAIPLERQGPVVPPAGWSAEGFGESDPDEIVEVLERLYADREATRSRGLQSAIFASQLSWSRTVRQYPGLLSVDGPIDLPHESSMTSLSP